MELTFEALSEGMTAEFSRTVEVADIDAFAGLTGDLNPLHMDADHARNAGMRDRVVHGAFLAGLVSQFVGMHLPGKHGLLLGMQLEFAAPTFPGDQLTVSGKINSLHPATRVVALRLNVSCGSQVRARGTATVQLRPAERS